MIPFWIYDTIMLESYTIPSKKGLPQVNLLPPENIYLNYIEERSMRILEEITIEPISKFEVILGPNYMFLDSEEK